MHTDHLARGTPARTTWFDGYFAGLAASCRVATLFRHATRRATRPNFVGVHAR